jgi:hypothetical protein
MLDNIPPLPPGAIPNVAPIIPKPATKQSRQDGTPAHTADAPARKSRFEVRKEKLSAGSTKTAEELRAANPEFAKLADMAQAGAFKDIDVALITPQQLRIKCQNLAPAMLLVLMEVASNPRALEASRISAATTILDRGYGKVGSLISITADIAQMDDDAALTFVLDEVSAGRITTADAAVLADIVVKRQQVIDIKALAVRLAELEEREKARVKSGDLVPA